jgi:hypothetical protein
MRKQELWLAILKQLLIQETDVIGEGSQERSSRFQSLRAVSCMTKRFRLRQFEEIRWGLELARRTIADHPAVHG